MSKYHWTIFDTTETYTTRFGNIRYLIVARFATEAEAKEWLKTQDQVKVGDYDLYAHR